MSSSTLRLVVVLYRTPLRTVRPFLRQLEALALPVKTLLSVTINRDRDERPRLRRCTMLAQGLVLEVTTKSNSSGVAGAYQFEIARSRQSDILLLLDADSCFSDGYLSYVASLRDRLCAETAFACPDLRAGKMRVSPYRLEGVVPIVWPTSCALPAAVRLSHHWGVINAGLAGAAHSFARVDGFDPRIGVDMSDVAWSIAAGKAGVTCFVHGQPQAHDLSMVRGGFSTERLWRYTRAAWRIARVNRDPVGFLRLGARGLRAWLRRRQVLYAA